MKIVQSLSTSLFVLFVSTLALPAFAQTSDTLLAESLFEEGRKLMDQGNYDAACPKLKESQRLDPGVGTLLNLGICYEKAGKFASAWLTFKEARFTARRENDEERAKFAEQKIHSVEPLLSYVVVQVEDDSADTKVSLDGHDIPRAAWGTRLPVDPGEHAVRAEANGKKAWTKKWTVTGKASVVSVRIPQLEPSPRTTPTNASGASTQTAVPSSPEANGDSSSVQVNQADGASQGASNLGYILTGAGVVALGAGGYFGLKALSTWDDRNEHCPGDTCDDQGKTLEEDANRQANIANVSIGLGLVGVGVGAYLLLSDPSENEAPPNSRASVHVAPAFAESSAGLLLHGSW